MAVKAQSTISLASVKTVNDASQYALQKAGEAEASAENASQYASRALGNLSTVQSVTETLAWITQHGAMSLTTDTALDPTHVYFVVDPNGDYVVGSTHYSIVAEPDEDDIATYYELSINESLNNYVATHLALTNEGLWLLPDNSGYKILIATGAGVRDAGTYIIDADDNTVAKFGETVTLGLDDGTHLELDRRSIKAIDMNGNEYFNVSDLRNDQGYYEATDNFTGDGEDVSFNLSYRLDTNYPVTVTVNNVALVAEEEYWLGRDILYFYEPTQDTSIVSGKTYYTKSGTWGGVLNFFRVRTPVASDLNTYFERIPPASGASISIVYSTTSTEAKGYTLGKREPNTNVGGYSFAEGYYTEASGQRSHAEGYGACASGENSHAENSYTTASGEGSHAEGTETKASGTYSHAEGYWTESRGSHSHASGEHTIANSANQTVLGEYNAEDTAGSTATRGTYALIVGNGSGENGRSDALELSWTGRLIIASTLTQNSDKRLKDHREYLGKDAVDFVQKLKPAHYTKDGEDHLGFYAQEVEEVDPWGCMIGEMNGYKTLGYTEIIAPLVAYCQHLEERIAELERKDKWAEQR